MNNHLRVVFSPIALRQPYDLSFGPIDSFDTFFIILTLQGVSGFGEITPLPGYSSENPESIFRDIKVMSKALRKGVPLDEALDDIKSNSPFVASGFKTAIETSGSQNAILRQPISRSVPLTALCAGGSIDEITQRASHLLECGYRTLKLKVGKLAVVDEIARLKAVHTAVGNTALLRLDANQAYTFSQAAQLCRGIEGLEGIELLEQPFLPYQWEDVRRLVEETSIPIMLDESIWTADDVEMASQAKASLVKFKLCKHFGIQESLDLIELARSKGLRIVYGNGVQSALGNHFEAHVFNMTHLDADSESNGFLKAEEGALKHSFVMNSGKIVSGRVDIDSVSTISGKVLVDISF